MKRILFLAPQPFFQERGTPIAVRMAVETLGNSGKYQIDLLTYHEGFDISIPNVTHHRMWAPGWLYGIRPGISVKKLVADLFFFLAALRFLLWRQFDFIHAVEESVYIALPFAVSKKIPLVYDMDSSLSEQITESWGFLKPFASIFRALEKITVRSSAGVLVVCDALRTTAQSFHAAKVECLYDVSLLSEQTEPTKEHLRETIKASADTKLILYIGNLESYQGIDLLVESTALLSTKTKINFHVVILGGASRHLEKYANLAKKLGIESSLSLLGSRPLSMLGSYLAQADLLVSPRIKGNNTPMKIYSYLDSNVPLVATKLATHTQVISDDEAFLAEATPDAFAVQLAQALADPTLAAQKAAAAKELVTKKYNRVSFNRTLLQFYSEMS